MAVFILTVCDKCGTGLTEALPIECERAPVPSYWVRFVFNGERFSWCGSCWKKIKEPFPRERADEPLK